MNILVLGGNGYLGSKVIKRLIDEGHKLVCTKRANSDMSRVKGLSREIEWISDDIQQVSWSINKTECDYVLNMACNYGRDSEAGNRIIEANLSFPLKVFNAAVENGVKNILTVGTGLPDDLNLYSHTKKQLKEFGKYYVEKNDINFTNISLEMFYGIDEPESRFLSSMIRKMILGEEVEMTLGTQKRDIIEISDVVKAIEIIINANLEGYHDISVGTGVGPTISEIADFIWEKTGRKSIVKKGVVPMRENEPNCIADNEFIRSLGKWDPVDWRSGLENIINTLLRKGNHTK